MKSRLRRELNRELKREFIRNLDRELNKDPQVEKSSDGRSTSRTPLERLSWECEAPTLRCSDSDKVSMRIVPTLPCPEQPQMAQLSEEWFLERIRPSFFEEIEAKERRRATALWYREALSESEANDQWASLAQRLRQLGAPISLIKGCARAMLDEIDHARLAFTMVRALGGAEVQFERFAIESASERGAQPALSLNEELFQCALRALHRGVLVQELSSRFAIQLSRGSDYQPIASELLKKSLDERRHSDLCWDIFSWALKKLGRDSLKRLWTQWTNAPRPHFAEGLVGEGKTRDIYREVREEISERLQKFFEREWGVVLSEFTQNERPLPISRPAS